MNQEQLTGNWQQIKGKLKSKWGKLTDDDLLASEGKRDVLIGKLTERYGYSKEKAAEKLDSYLEHFDDLGQEVKSIPRTLSNFAEDVSTKASETVKNCGEYAKHNPWTTIGVVAAVGVVIGVLISTSKN